MPLNLPTNSILVNELCTIKSRTINIKGEILITEIYDDYFLKMMYGTFHLLTNLNNFKITLRDIKTKEKYFL
ncbi:transposase B regulatory protein [Staphylococcus aureus]|nr:transposase B regulatory protein [Staphylococcus aureus]